MTALGESRIVTAERDDRVSIIAGAAARRCGEDDAGVTIGAGDDVDIVRIGQSNIVDQMYGERKHIVAAINLRCKNFNR